MARYHQRPLVEYYDLRGNPLKQRNLADGPGHRATIADMRGKLERWMRQQGEDPFKVASPSEVTEEHFPYAQ